MTSESLASALNARLTGEGAERAFEDVATQVLEHLLDRPLGELVEASSLLAALERGLSEEGFERVIGPVSAAVGAAVDAVAAGDTTKLGTYVDGEAREALLRFASRPDLVPKPLLDAVLGHEALEAVMRDVLYESMRDFNEKVNPFFAEWGLPSLLKRFVPFGVGKAVEGFREEFDRRLEPELRRFLKGAARIALRSMGRFVLEKQGEPAFVSLRRELVMLALEQQVSTFTKTMPDDARAELRAVALLTAKGAAQLDTTRAFREVLVRSMLARHQRSTVRQLLAGAGVELLDVRPFVRAAWPLARAVLSSPPVRAEVTRLAALAERDAG
jgi:uncharacterized protein (DUF1778 family)